jgi:hypothetical protein
VLKSIGGIADCVEMAVGAVERSSSSIRPRRATFIGATQSVLALGVYKGPCILVRDCRGSMELSQSSVCEVGAGLASKLRV